MTKYSSQPYTVERSAADISDRFADLTRMETSLQDMPEEQRAKIGQLKFDTDSITVVTPQVGDITLKVVERNPERIVFAAEKSPVPMNIMVEMQPKSEASTEVTTSVEVEIPAMLRPLIGPQLQKVADQFGSILANINR